VIEMEFQLIFSEQAKEKLLALETDKSKKGLLKQLRKALGLMETNLKHPSLNTHKFVALQCKLGDVFESYVQNRIPGAFRIFWAYGPRQKQIYILDITPHP
jgi:hypothetical protein